MSLESSKRIAFSNVIASLCALLRRDDFAGPEIDEGRGLLDTARALLGTPLLATRFSGCVCGRYVRFNDALPPLPCPVCDFNGHADKLMDQRDRALDVPELFVYGHPLDRLQTQWTLADSTGRLFKFAGPQYVEGWPRDHHEKLVAELQKVKDENREVLAENARLRRSLDAKSLRVR